MDKIESMKLNFADGEVQVPLRAVSYKATSEILKIRLSLSRRLAALDEEYRHAFAETQNENGEKQYTVVDYVAAGEKEGAVRLEVVAADLLIARVIVDTGNLTTAQKEEMLSDEFWDAQDYASKISPAVSSFRQQARI